MGESVRDCLNKRHYGRALVPLLGPYLNRIEIGTYYPGICQTYGFGRETVLGREFVFSTAEDDEHERPKYALTNSRRILIKTDDPSALVNEIAKHL